MRRNFDGRYRIGRFFEKLVGTLLYQIADVRIRPYQSDKKTFATGDGSLINVTLPDLVVGFDVGGKKIWGYVEVKSKESPAIYDGTPRVGIDKKHWQSYEIALSLVSGGKRKANFIDFVFVIYGENEYRGIYYVDYGTLKKSLISENDNWFFFDLNAIMSNSIIDLANLLDYYTSKGWDPLEDSFFTEN